MNEVSDSHDAKLSSRSAMTGSDNRNTCPSSAIVSLGVRILNRDSILSIVNFLPMREAFRFSIVSKKMYTIFYSIISKKYEADIKRLRDERKNREEKKIIPEIDRRLHVNLW